MTRASRGATRPRGRGTVGAFRAVRDEYLDWLVAPASSLPKPFAEVQAALREAYTAAVKAEDPSRGRIYADLMDLEAFIEHGDAALVQRYEGVPREAGRVDPILDRVVAARVRLAAELEAEDPRLKDLDVNRIDIRQTEAETMEFAPRRIVIGGFDPATIWPASAPRRVRALDDGLVGGCLFWLASVSYIVTMLVGWASAPETLVQHPHIGPLYVLAGWFLFFLIWVFSVFELDKRGCLDVVSRLPRWLGLAVVGLFLVMPGILWALAALTFASLLAGS